MKRTLRVFPRRTTHTPDDDLVAIDAPGLFLPKAIDEVLVSCLFTWDRDRCDFLAEAWQRRLRGVPVILGGPVYDGSLGSFVPGRFTKHGITINSRGCPNNCSFCLVPRREGKLRLLDISLGHIVQDNNVLAFPKAHFSALCKMLQEQKHEANFTGGLEAARLTDWHVDQLKKLRIRELWFAADSDAALPALRKATAKFKELHRRQKRCYVLAGYNGESMSEVEARLEAAWGAGCVPFVQLYRNEADDVKYDREWRAFRRKWCRMRAICSAHKEA